MPPSAPRVGLGPPSPCVGDTVVGNNAGRSAAGRRAMAGQGPPSDAQTSSARQKESGPKPAFPCVAWRAPDQYLLIVPSTSSAQAWMPPVTL